MNPGHGLLFPGHEKQIENPNITPSQVLLLTASDLLKCTINIHLLIQNMWLCELCGRLG